MSGLTYSGGFIGPGCSFCLHQDSISGKPLGRLCLRDPPEQHVRYDWKSVYQPKWSPALAEGRAVFLRSHQLVLKLI